MCAHRSRSSIPDADLQTWQAEISQLFEEEIKIHFTAEEAVIFPAARQFAELVPLAEELTSEHASLRELFCQAEAHGMSPETLLAFAQQLSAHIRKEERLLFESMQQLMKPSALASLGIGLETALKEVAHSCLLPNEATKLKGKR